MSATPGLAGYGLPFWLDLERPRFPTLDRNITADACVIGAGIAGLKLVRCLNRYGFATVVLEAARAGEGASARNQGSINHSPSFGYLDAINRYSHEVARELWRMGLENHRLLHDQIEEYVIDCDYQIDGMTSLVRRDIAGWETLLENYRQEYELLREDGFQVSLLDEASAIDSGGSPLYAGGLCYLNDAQLHSGKYVIGLAEGVGRLPNVRLYEDTRVDKIEAVGSGVRVTTKRGVVSAGVAFVATNALVPQFIPELVEVLRAERGQVFVTEPLAERPCKGSFSATRAWWREIIEPDGRFRLLFGGGRDRDEPDSLFPQYRSDGTPYPKLESSGFSPSAEHQLRLDTQFFTLFPRFAQARVTHRWAGLQSFSADGLPVLGIFDAGRHIYGIAGFSGRGNCHSDVAAEYLIGKVAGVESDMEKRFGALIEAVLRVGRSSAVWGPWTTVHCES